MGKHFEGERRKKATKVAEAAGAAAVGLLVVAALKATPRIAGGVAKAVHYSKARGRYGMGRLRDIRNKIPRIPSAKDG